MELWPEFGSKPDRHPAVGLNLMLAVSGAL